MFLKLVKSVFELLCTFSLLVILNPEHKLHLRLLKAWDRHCWFSKMENCGFDFNLQIPIQL